MSTIAPASASPATAIDNAGLAAFAIGALAVACSPIFTRYAEMAPLAGATWRLVSALPILVLWSRLGPAPAVRPSRGGLLATAIAGVAFAIDLWCFHAAVPLTSLANASFIANCAPLIAGALAFVLFGERVSRSIWIGLGISAAGAAVLAASRNGGGDGALTGDLLAAGSAVSYAVYFVAVRYARASMDAAGVMLGSTVVAAVLITAGAIIAGEPLLPTSMASLAAILCLGVVSHAAGQGLMAVGLGRTPVALAGLLVLAQPVVTSLMAWPLFGETFNAIGILGGAMVLGGLAVARR